ncbi:MAG: AbrB family transcriptional regulator [Aliishimia sp.]
MSPFALLKDVPNTALMLSIGLVGAVVAVLLGLPMPFLMGALASVGFYAAMRTARGQSEAHFPKPLRRLFVGLIGVMIGASFTADLLGSLPAIWPSLLAMIGFVGVALGLGYAIFRILGRYDKVTAFYSAMPGGLIEAVSLGEEAGGDVRVLALQHFARIVVVVVTVPLLYLAWTGQAVGSAGGQSFEVGTWDWFDVIELFAIAVVGMWIGPHLRFPAAHMVGPLVLSAVLHGSGMLHLSSPFWLLALAQLMVGCGLGVSFAGATLRDLMRAFGLGTVYVVVILGLSYTVAFVLSGLLPFSFDTLFVSFAPGGVTEMGLIALSLGISPVVVTVLHVFRIALTVAVAGILAKRLRS